MSYRQSSTLILHTCNSFISFFHTCKLYSVLSHLQSLFRSFTLTIFIPFFHTNNLYSVCSHLQSLFRSFTLAIPSFHYFILTILIPFFHTYNLYFVLSHLQFHYSVLSHLQSLFRSFTLTIFIPLFHTCNLYFIHTMHHNTLSNLLWIVGSWTYILYTDELNQWPEAYDTWQQIKLLNGVSLYSCCNMESQRFCIT
jgi:hypothetical protein